MRQREDGQELTIQIRAIGAIGACDRESDDTFPILVQGTWIKVQGDPISLMREWKALPER